MIGQGILHQWDADNLDRGSIALHQLTHLVLDIFVSLISFFNLELFHDSNCNSSQIRLQVFWIDAAVVDDSATVCISVDLRLKLVEVDGI